MTANTQFDCRLKCGLIDDVLTIVDLQGVLLGDEMQVGGFDLIIDKGIKVNQNKHFEYTGTLGFKNERKKVMNQIGKNFLQNKQKQKLAQQK